MNDRGRVQDAGLRMGQAAAPDPRPYEREEDLAVALASLEPGAWRQLFHAPNLFTVPGDPLAGYMLALSGGAAAGGTALGLTLALGLTRLLSSLLFGVKPTDAVTFAGIPVVLALAATAASLVPAISATTVEPGAALREE